MILDCKNLVLLGALITPIQGMTSPSSSESIRTVTILDEGTPKIQAQWQYLMFERFVLHELGNEACAVFTWGGFAGGGEGNVMIATDGVAKAWTLRAPAKDPDPKLIVEQPMDIAKWRGFADIRKAAGNLTSIENDKVFDSLEHELVCVVRKDDKTCRVTQRVFMKLIDEKHRQHHDVVKALKDLAPPRTP